MFFDRPMNFHRTMTLANLRNYEYWVGKTPLEIKNAVKSLGGWKVIFPHDLPLWAHRVRNYFNREPLALMRLDDSQAEKHINEVNVGLPKNASFIERGSLKRYVYKDSYSKVWFQMSEGATIYHWGKDPQNPKAEAFYHETIGSVVTTLPIFKLVSPDDTGGSYETIIRNTHPPSVPHYRIFHFTNQLETVQELVVTDNWHRGSYNYSETIEEGLPAHQLRDVKPHEAFKFNNVYVNPLDCFSSLRFRRFPQIAPNETVPLAKQIKSPLGW